MPEFLPCCSHSRSAHCCKASWCSQESPWLWYTIGNLEAPTGGKVPRLPWFTGVAEVCDGGCHRSRKPTVTLTDFSWETFLDPNGKSEEFDMFWWNIWNVIDCAFLSGRFPDSCHKFSPRQIYKHTEDTITILFSSLH